MPNHVQSVFTTYSQWKQSVFEYFSVSPIISLLSVAQTSVTNSKMTFWN